MEIQKRGMLTEKIKLRSLELLGYEIDTTELRLMPYIIDIMMNDQEIDPDKINAAERKILKRWRIDGHIVFSDKMWISRKFWDTICELVFLGYVDLQK